MNRDNRTYVRPSNHGLHARAADYYRKTVDFISHPDRIDDYETLHIYQEELEKQERLAGLR